MNGRRTRRLSALLILALVLSAGTYAFAAANTVADSYAGDGDGVVSGYNVTAVQYTINADADPSDVDEVTFTLDNAADEVFVQLNGLGSFYTCVGAGFNWTCDVSAGGEAVLTLTSLKVISAN